MRNAYSPIINEVIRDGGHGLNPSVNGLLLYGDVIRLTDESRKILEKTAQIHKNMYDLAVLPRIPQLMRALLKDNSLDFRIEDAEQWNIEEYRRVLAKEYLDKSNRYVNARQQKEKVSNQVTLNTVIGKAPLPEVNYRMEESNFYPDLSHGRIISARPKNISKLSEKQREKIIKVIQEDQETEGTIEQAYEFVKQVITHQSSYWTPEVRTEFLNYPKTIRSILVGDNLGVRALIMNRRKAKKTQDNILQQRGLENLGFNIVYDRLEDHRDRRKEEQPGGIHLTATDKGMHLPIEVQVIDVVDAIYDAFGPKAHWRYKDERRRLLDDFKYA